MVLANVTRWMARDRLARVPLGDPTGRDSHNAIPLPFDSVGTITSGPTPPDTCQGVMRRPQPSVPPPCMRIRPVRDIDSRSSFARAKGFGSARTAYGKRSEPGWEHG